MMRLLIVIAVLLAQSLAVRTAGAIELAGTVAVLQGSASAVGSSDRDRWLHTGSTILVGDRLHTNSDARLRMVLNDGAQITLGENSALVIRAFDADENKGSIELSFERGLIVATGGRVAAMGPGRFTIGTPLATFTVGEGEVLGDLYPDRLVLTLLSGTGSTITTPQGSVELAEPGTGVDIVADAPPPQPTPRDGALLESTRQAVTF